MTAKAAFTQASVRRAIKAAQQQGLRVAGIRPDGTVIIGDEPLDRGREHGEASPPSKWEDVEA